MSDLHVPGYDVGDLLGYGATGEVWSARDRVSHAAVALKRMRVPDPAARERLLREATVLARVTHPHVVRLLDVLEVDGAVVLVLEHAAGGSLRQLLAARGPLRPGEVVTVLVPLAQALAAVHEHGVVHGDVTPANVLLTADGRPLLGDLGVSRLLGVPAHDAEATAGYVDPAVAAGAAPGPASDVHGLAATCWAALVGRPPYDELGQRRRPWAPGPDAGDLLAVLESGLAPDSAQRPGPDAFAVAAYQAAEPVPLQRPGLPLDVEVTPDGEAATYRVRVAAPPGPDDAAPVRGRRRRSPGPARRPRLARAGGRMRRAALGALLLAGLWLAVLTVVAAWPGSPVEPTDAAALPAQRAGDTEPVGPTRPDSAAARSPAQHGVPRSTGPPRRPPAVEHGAAAADRWAAVLRRLDARRAEAFARADPAALEDVYAASAPALRRDRARLATLVARGQRAAGVRLRAVSVAVQAQSAGAVVLRVVDVLEPYRLRSLDSGRVTTAPGRAARRWRVTLHRDGGRWEVYDVAAD